MHLHDRFNLEWWQHGIPDDQLIQLQSHEPFHPLITKAVDPPYHQLRAGLVPVPVAVILPRTQYLSVPVGLEEHPSRVRETKRHPQVNPFVVVNVRFDSFTLASNFQRIPEIDLVGLGLCVYQTISTMYTVVGLCV